MELPGEASTLGSKQTQQDELDNISLEEIDKLMEEIHKSSEKIAKPSQDAEEAAGSWWQL